MKHSLNPTRAPITRCDLVIAALGLGRLAFLRDYSYSIKILRDRMKRAFQYSSFHNSQVCSSLILPYLIVV